MNNEEERYIIHMENVYQRYGDKVILDDIDLKVRDGEFLCIVGPSGCGKSTLLRMIVGQEKPYSGIFLLDGKPVGKTNSDRGIVFQRYSLFPHLNVLDNVLLGKKLSLGIFGYAGKKKDCIKEAEEILEFVKLQDHLTKKPHELSGGQCQRVAIAQALIMKHKILLMDEPLGALDPFVREELQYFIVELWHKLKMTIFFITHDLEEAVYVGSRVIVLSQFYTDGRGNGNGVKRGARIIIDEPLPTTRFRSWKETTEFAALIAGIRRGFSGENLPHINDFTLNHPDSFRTLTPEEEKR